MGRLRTRTLESAVQTADPLASPPSFAARLPHHHHHQPGRQGDQLTPAHPARAGLGTRRLEAGQDAVS